MKKLLTILLVIFVVFPLIVLLSRSFSPWSFLPAPWVSYDDEKSRKIDEIAQRVMDEHSRSIQESQNRTVPPTSTPTVTNSGRADVSTSNTRQSSAPGSQPTSPSSQQPQPPEDTTVTPSPAPAPSVDIPSSNISYRSVPDQVKNKEVNCATESPVLGPLDSTKVYCVNLYRTDRTALTDAPSNFERALLTGQYSWVNCPINYDASLDAAGRCFDMAKFYDNWQLPKMFEVLGLGQPHQKIYLHYYKDPADVDRACHSNVVSCFKNEFAVYRPAMMAGNNLFHTESDTGNYTLTIGQNREILYKYTETTPRNCFVPDLHETVHYLNFQFLGYKLPVWLDEGITRIIESRLFKPLCPPNGQVYSNVTKNGASVSNFSFDQLDIKEPLLNDFVAYSEGSQCRKGVYMQTARLLNTRGLSFVRNFYNELKILQDQHDETFAKALWLGSGRDESTRIFLMTNQCDLSSTY